MDFQLHQPLPVTQAPHHWTLPLPDTLMLTAPDSAFEDYNAPPVPPISPESPYPPTLLGEVAPPSIRATKPPFHTTRREAAVALITCVLVVIIGSLSNPIFVTVRHSDLSPSEPFSLLCRQVPASMPHDNILLAMKDEAFKAGIPAFGEVLNAGVPSFGEVLTAAVYENLQVFVMPLLHMSQEVFINAAEQTTPVVQGSFGMEFLSWDQIVGSIIELPCACAFQVITSFAEQVIPHDHAWELDVDNPSDPPEPEPIDLSDARGWELAFALTRATEASLLAAFRAVPRVDPHYGYLTANALQVLASWRPSLLEVPPFLRRLTDPHVSNPDLRQLPFSNRYTPVFTERLPRPRQNTFTTYQPWSYYDILSAPAIQEILEWLTIEHSNMVALNDFGSDVRRVPNALSKLGFGIAVQPHDVLVIGQDQFLPQARNIVWDCRGFALGLPAVPMDFDAPVHSDLSSPYIQRVLEFWPDQELLGFLIDGVDFRADLPLQIVLGPQLVSLSKAYPNAQKEIIRLHGLGYQDLHNCLPFLPIRDVPQGSTPRKHEIGRDRRTSDGGYPRKAACDKTGLCAVSLNDAIGLHSAIHTPAGDQPKWKAPEVKPRIEDKAWDDSILLNAALLVFKEPLNGFTDDFADYFNQIPLAPAYYWTSCFSWWFGDSFLGDQSLQGFLSTPTPPLTYVAEKRLGFGGSLSSNVAQRVSEAVVADFRQQMDIEETKLFALVLDPVSGLCTPYNVPDSTTFVDGWTDACRWIHERRMLSIETGKPQERLYSVHIYTDDPVFSVVGNERLLRAMRIWNKVTKDWGFRTAIARKRQVGPCICWLGFNFYLPMGIVAVAPDKIARAVQLLNSILAGTTITFNQYRSFIGLLEHMLVFVGGDRTFMYSLYGQNFQAGLAGGPLTRMIFTHRHFVALRRWSRVLLVRGGCFFSAAFRSHSVVYPPLRSHLQSSSLFMGDTPFSDVPLSLYSDAYVKERTLGNLDNREDLHGGLGGFAHGYWWHHPLSRRIAFLLHITAWEFMAYALNVIIFAPIVAGHPSFWFADAVSTIQTMIRSNTRSLAMQVIHELLIQSPEFAAIGPHQFHVHIYGRVNVPADAASRAMVSLLHAVTQQLGIVAVQIPLPERALLFLNRALDAIQAAQMDESPIQPPRIVPQEPSEDDDIEWLQTLPNAPHVDAPRAPLPDIHIFGEDSVSEDLSSEDLDGDPHNDHYRIPCQFRTIAPRAVGSGVSCVLLTEDGILCDADYDSESDDDEDLDGEPLDGDSESEDFDDEDLDGEPLDVHPYFTRDIPWNRDDQVLHMAGDDALDRDDDVWEQPPTVLLHVSPPTDPLPRAQSQEELDRMHHLGAAYFGAEDQPLQFKFKMAFGSLSPPEMGAIETDVSSAHRPPRRCRSPPLWRSPRYSDLADKRPATSRPSSPPVWKPVPMSQSAFTPSIVKTNGPLGHADQSFTRLRLAPPRPLFNGPMGPLPRIPPTTVLIEDVLTGRVQTSRLSHVFADALFNDNSEQALRPKNPTLLLAFAEAAQHGMQACVPKTTDAKNKTGWRLWEQFLDEIGGNTPPLRQPDTNPKHLLREQLLKNMFILWCRTKCTSSLPGRVTCKPDSLLAHLYAVKREHDKHGLTFLTKGSTHQVTKSLGLEYAMVHGPEALAPRKQEALSPAMVKALIRTVNGLPTTLRNLGTIQKDSWLARNVKGALALSGCGGFRLAEVSLVDGSDFTAMKMSRASLFFIIQGVVKRCPSAQELCNMRPAKDRVGVLACAAKNDPLVLHFLPSPIIVGFNPKDPEDAGLILRDLALHCPVTSTKMRSTPLFTYSPGGKALGYSFLSGVFKTLLRQILPSASAELFSWHSFRSGLACALRAAQAPDWVLLALLRWRSKSSIPGYGRLSFEAASAWLDQASTQKQTTLTAASLPSLTQEATQIPNILPESTYDFLDKAKSLHIEQVDLQSFHEGLPQYDDDGFMAELRALPDQDELEELRVPGTW